MDKCPDNYTIEKWMNDLLVGEEADSIRAHIKSCEGCSNIASKIRSMNSSIESAFRDGLAQKPDVKEVTRFIEKLVKDA